MRLFRRALFWGLVLLAVAALAAPKLMNKDRGRGGAQTAPAKPPPPEVEVHVVAAERLTETLISPGTLVANERIEVVSESAGLVQRIAFEEGTRVGAGDLLVKIDDRELLAERDRTTARLDLAERQATRQRELHDKGLISDNELEVATTSADALRAELQQIEVRLAKTEIRAPFAGIIGLRRVSEGAFLSPQTRIAILVQNDPIKLDFAVPERYASRFRKGDDVTFRVEGVAGNRLAILYAVEPSVDPATRTVTMRARSPNADGRLLPGSFADVEVSVREVKDALTVPSIAVIPELGGKKVWVIEGGAAQPRQIETGIRTGDRLEVTRGLAAGERVIVTGVQLMRSGLAVEAAPATGPAEAAVVGAAATTVPAPAETE